MQRLEKNRCVARIESLKSSNRITCLQGGGEGVPAEEEGVRQVPREPRADARAAEQAWGKVAKGDQAPLRKKGEEREKGKKEKKKKKRKRIPI